MGDWFWSQLPHLDLGARDDSRPGTRKYVPNGTRRTEAAITKTLVANIAGRAIDISVEGNGPPVLLLPGGAVRTRGYWLDLPQQLAAFASVISMDRPGTGTSPQDGPRLTLAHQAEHLAEIVRLVGLGPVVILAHSLGGPVSMQFAKDHPDSVAALALLDPTPISPRLIGGAVAVGLRLAATARCVPGLRLDPERTVTASLRKQLRDRPWTDDLQAVAQTMISDDQVNQVTRLLRGFTTDAGLLAARLRDQPVTLPCAVITGERSSRSLLAMGHAKTARMLSTTALAWPGTTHVIHLQRPREVADLVRSLMPSLAT